MKTHLVSALAASIMLSGCAAWYPKTNADQDKPIVDMESLKSDLDQATRKATERSSFKTSNPWLVAEEITEFQRYPTLDAKPITISQFNQTLPQMVNRISDLLGVNVFLASDLYLSMDGDVIERPGGGGATGQPQSVGGAEVIDTSSVLTLMGRSGFGGDSGRFGNPLDARITAVSNGGSATALLDNISAQLGISWKYDKPRNRVTFFRLTQENFQVFFPGESEMDVEAGRSGDSDSVISQSSKFETEGGSWEEIAEGVQALLSPYGKATIVKSTGNIVVSDTPEAMEQVTQYVESVNDIFGRQVYLQIRTATVAVDNANDFNLTWNNILNTVNSGQFDVGLNSAAVPTTGLPNAINVIRSATGASLALEMLASASESTEINEQSVTTISNQPTSLKVLTETGFISGISQQTQNVNLNNVVSDVQTDTVNTGFDATLLPRVVSDSSLQLQVALELSSNLTLVNFDSTIVQTPTRDRNSVVQRAWLQNGETWVLAAFTSDKTNKEERGTGSPGFWGLGGGTSKSKSNQVLLVMITPHIQNGVF